MEKEDSANEIMCNNKNYSSEDILIDLKKLIEIAKNQNLKGFELIYLIEEYIRLGKYVSQHSFLRTGLFELERQIKENPKCTVKMKVCVDSKTTNVSELECFIDRNGYFFHKMMVERVVCENGFCEIKKFERILSFGNLTKNTVKISDNYGIAYIPFDSLPKPVSNGEFIARQRMYFEKLEKTKENKQNKEELKSKANNNIYAYLIVTFITLFSIYIYYFFWGF